MGIAGLEKLVDMFEAVVSEDAVEMLEDESKVMEGRITVPVCVSSTSGQHPSSQQVFPISQ